MPYGTAAGLGDSRSQAALRGALAPEAQRSWTRALVEGMLASMKTLMMMLFLFAGAAQATPPEAPTAPAAPAAESATAPRWHQSDWWEVLKLMAPVLTAFAAFTYAAHRNFNYNRRLQELNREREAASLAAALNMEAMVVLGSVVTILEFLKSPAHTAGNYPSYKEVRRMTIRSMDLFDANKTKITLFEPETVIHLLDAHLQLEYLKETFGQMARQDGQVSEPQMRRLIMLCQNVKQALDTSFAETARVAWPDIGRPSEGP